MRDDGVARAMPKDESVAAIETVAAAGASRCNVSFQPQAVVNRTFV